MPINPEHNAIVSLIPAGSRVLDIGCGTGALMQMLALRNIEVRGFDIDSANVAATLASGLSAVQGDADSDLTHYPDQAFDYVVLSKTLQATKQPKEVLKELLRVANKVVVVIPNFGFWKNRLYLLLKGRMPVTSTLSYQWYETPNIHFCTIHDFIALTQEIGATIEAQNYLDSSGALHAFTGKSHRANLFGESGLFVLSKN